MTTARNINNQQFTYHDDYDSNDECGPFFDAVSGEIMTSKARKKVWLMPLHPH